MKCFREIPASSNNSRLLEVSHKTSCNSKQAKCNHSSKIFSICMSKPKKFHRTPDETTGKRSVETNLNIKKEIKENFYSATIFAELFNQRLLTLHLLLKVQPHRSLKNVSKFLIIVMTQCLPFQPI